MFVVLEFVAFACLFVVVWAIYRAANARPDEPSLLWFARLSLIIWVGFVAYRFISIEGLTKNASDIVQIALIVALISGAVAFYRFLLRRVRDQSDR